MKKSVILLHRFHWMSENYGNTKFAKENQVTKLEWTLKTEMSEQGLQLLHLRNSRQYF